MACEGPWASCAVYLIVFSRVFSEDEGGDSPSVCGLLEAYIRIAGRPAQYYVWRDKFQEA